MWSSLIISLLSSAFTASAQTGGTNQTDVYVGPGVIPGVPVAGNYTGGLRPQIHFSPPKNFMNDPNGCFVDANGTWHLYYQCKQPSEICLDRMVLTGYR